MTYDVTCRIKPYIQPFERRLALQELAALAGARPRPLPAIIGEPDRFRVRSRIASDALARQLAFWEIAAGDSALVTQQSLRESTANIARNGITLDELANTLPFNGSVPLPNRRCLRYASHGAHEYRGKFFPQLVRALINIANTPRGSLIADPFCGSGTTAVEAILAQRNAMGIDMNPLSVFVTRTKCAVLSVPVKQLENAFRAVERALLQGKKPSKKYSRMVEASDADARYLNAWFHPRILEQLDTIYGTIHFWTGRPIRDFFLISLSNILRKVSWQKEDDLRIRKENKRADDLDPVKEFLAELNRSIKFVIAFLRQENAELLGRILVQEADARNLTKIWQRWAGKIKLVITSPPYATALPYLDTDRLSLCFLGLLPRDRHRQWDHRMIGNREITDRTRRQYWDQFLTEKKSFPSSVSTLIAKIAKLNLNNGAGFRRKNLPSLLYKYFADMRQVLIGLETITAPGGHVFVVVGNNHTKAGGKHVSIQTAELLVELAESIGLEVMESIPMEMLVSRDLFRRNAIASETILHFQRRS